MKYKYINTSDLVPHSDLLSQNATTVDRNFTKVAKKVTGRSKKL